MLKSFFGSVDNILSTRNKDAWMTLSTVSFTCKNRVKFTVPCNERHKHTYMYVHTYKQVHPSMHTYIHTCAMAHKVRKMHCIVLLFQYHFL